jgi:hypothetical protein
MTHACKVASTNQILYFRAFNTDGTSLTTFTSATAGAALSVYRVGGSSVAIASLSDKAADDTAHADGAIRQVGSGNLYTVDIPDAGVATQFPSVCIKGSYTGGVIEGIPSALVGYDGTDAVRIGMTALPNAVADAAGGLPISDAGGLDLDTILDNIYALHVTGITTAVEAAAGKHSVAGTVMMSTNAALSGGTLTANKPSDDTTFSTYAVSTDETANNIVGVS